MTMTDAHARVAAWRDYARTRQPVGTCTVGRCQGPLLAELPNRWGAVVFLDAVCDLCGHRDSRPVPLPPPTAPHRRHVRRHLPGDADVKKLAAADR